MRAYRRIEQVGGGIMGTCNFGGSVLGCIAVGMVGADSWTDEDREEYRQMVGDDDLTDDYVDNCLWFDEGEHISEVQELSQRFIEDLRRFVCHRFFEYLNEEEIPLKISLDNGCHSGFEMRTVDAYGFYWEQTTFLEAQAEDWAKYYSGNEDFTPAEWCKHVEKAIDFIDYALVRFGYNKELSYITGGYAGGASQIDTEDVREFARFEKYGSELAQLWWAFFQKYGKEYNQIGL